MAVSYQIQEQRGRVFGAMLAAAALSIPVMGLIIMGFLIFYVPVMILLRSEERIKDLIVLATFVACYAAANALSAYVFGIFWPQYALAYGVPVWPLSFYFVHKIDQSISN